MEKKLVPFRKVRKPKDNREIADTVVSADEIAKLKAEIERLEHANALAADENKKLKTNALAADKGTKKETSAQAMDTNETPVAKYFRELKENGNQALSKNDQEAKTQEREKADKSLELKARDAMAIIYGEIAKLKPVLRSAKCQELIKQVENGCNNTRDRFDKTHEHLYMNVPSYKKISDMIDNLDSLSDKIDARDSLASCYFGDEMYSAESAFRGYPHHLHSFNMDTNPYYREAEALKEQQKAEARAKEREALSPKEKKN